MQLVYSRDDAINTGKGWYWQRFSDWKTSQSFNSETEAKAARCNGELVWGD